MTYTTLMNLEIFLDAAGICCCIFSIFYLIKLKRKTVSPSRISDPVHPEDLGPLNPTPTAAFAGSESFDEVLASIKNYSQVVAPDEERKKAGLDPYDEVRRLLDLGVGSDQIAGRINIPQCEIDLIANLRRMQPDTASDKTTENM